MRASPSPGVDEIPDAPFLARLRNSTQRYLESLDAWEAQFQKYYRVAAPGPGVVSADLESLHQRYLSARRELQECVPRARRLCRRHGLRDPWQATLHIALGAQTPQAGATTAIGKGERTLLAKCLADLEAASSAYAKAPEKEAATKPTKAPQPSWRGIFQRVVDYFF